MDQLPDNLQRAIQMVNDLKIEQKEEKRLLAQLLQTIAKAMLEIVTMWKANRLSDMEYKQIHSALDSLVQNNLTFLKDEEKREKERIESGEPDEFEVLSEHRRAMRLHTMINTKAFADFLAILEKLI